MLANLSDGYVIALKNLSAFPQSGRLVPEAERDDIREIIYQGYRVLYQFRDIQH